MTLDLRRPLAVAAAVLALAAVGAGTAAACDGGGIRAAEVKGASFTMHHGLRAHGLLARAAAYFGMTPEQLRAQLAAGKSLAQIAPAGRTASGLADALLAAARAKLDAAVANGWMTADQESAWLAKLSAKLPAFVSAVWTRRWSGGRDSGWVWGGHWHR